ncbi:11518_t:CDS:10, partial [Ambispora gerdemannii]
KMPTPYDLDPDLQAFLKIETFQGKFTTKEFVEKTTKNLLRSGNPKEFNPKPFIRTFESSIEELLKLRKTVQEQSDDLEGSVQFTEVSHRKKLQELTSTFEDVVTSFESLETRINEVGNTAIRIGEQLETIDRQRLRAAESKELIEFFMAFNRGDSTKLENLKKQHGREGQFKAAVIARRLNTIAKEVDIPGAEDAKARVEKFCEVLEKELLEQFDRAYRKGDAKTMKHCAKTLNEFNGCESCIKLYVNQHEFFITKVNMTENNLSSSSWNELANPEVPPPPADQGLVKLYEEIRETVKQEAEIINAVFPDPISVMQVFLQRIFAQLIQSHLEALLQQSEQDSTLAYLRTLSSVHAVTVDLVEDLKHLDMRQRKSSSDMLQNNNEEGVGPSKINTIVEVLNQCMVDLFVPYTEADRYIEKEKKSLNELYSSLLLQFNAYHIQRKQATKGSTLFQRAVNQISSSSSAGSSPNLNQTPGTNLMEKGIVPTTEEDGKLSVYSAMLILKIHAEAIRRSVELSLSNDRPKNASILYHVLLESIGKQYVDNALDTALDQIAVMDYKVDFDFKAITVVKVAREIIHLAQNHFQALPLASPSLSIHRELIADKNKFMLVVENKINLAVQRIIDAILLRLGHILSKQKKSDFKPKEDEVLTNLMTSPCDISVDFLKKVYANSNQFLDGKNLELFLTEVGMSFHSMLLDHLKKFSVSAAGGLVLTKDIAKYQETIALFKIPALDERFEMIRQLSNLFIVKPEILKSVLNEGYLAKIDTKYLHIYLQQRSDFKSAGIDQLIGINNTEASDERNFNEKARAKLASMGISIGSGRDSSTDGSGGIGQGGVVTASFVSPTSDSGLNGGSGGIQRLHVPDNIVIR